MTNTNDLSPQSRVWIYQAKEEINSEKLEALTSDLQQFTRNWTAHSAALKAAAEVKHQRFIILYADESQAGASGCSIDKSVRFLQSIEQTYDLDLFDRMTFTYLKDNKVCAADKDTFADLYAAGAIDNNTPVFDTLVKTKGQMDAEFTKKLGESWHARFV